jgi:hypothetical protein
LIFCVKATRAGLLEVLSFWNPVDAVYKLFCRSDWVYKYDGGLYELSMKLTFLLASLKPDQTATFEFDVEFDSDMHCFSHERRTSDSMLKILRAIFPTLQNKGRKARNKGLQYSIELRQGEGPRFETRTLFYWGSLHETIPTAQMVMNWRGGGVHRRDQDGKYFWTHNFSFRANSTWVRDRDDDWEALGNIRFASFLLPFVMGEHYRLGAMSPIRALHGNPDVLRLIGKYLVYC